MPSAQEIGVEDVLAVLTNLYALEGEVRHSEFRMLCPVHNDSRPSCDVNLNSGHWNCFSCPASGDLIGLGRVVLKKSRKAVQKLLQPNEPTAIVASIQRRSRVRRESLRPARKKQSKNVLIPPPGSYDPGPLRELRQRGFSTPVLKRWGIRHADQVTLPKETEGKFFTLTNALCIPILGESEDQIFGWCYRATSRSDNWFQNVRYIYTPGITDTLSEIWFGYNHHKDAGRITITEGALDAMWLDQHGIPALAILGSNVKQAVKIRKLMGYDHVTIMTDRDKTGVWTAWDLGQALSERGVPVSICRYTSWMLNRHGKPAKDANDLCGLDLELVHARAIPYLAWKRKVSAPPTGTT